MQIKAEQTVVLKEGDLLQLGRDSPTDKQPWQLAQQPVRLQWSPLLKERAVSLP